ncbi:hypothetical protein C2G38_2249583 [Gigaspora rosea]|uniref:Uncharacterized protein n=1 Tax=Gigaspora rosea TaxID=44941 RepID=A0A397UR66_9GLOM|nr:hypothetical protein C2G38_2249583 [Gigaspora rosea]
MCFYFIIKYLFILWHKINSTSKIETKKIDALLALSNEICNEIIEIRNDITEIRNEIPKICNDITEIRNEIPEIRNDITEILNSIPEIHNDITETRNDIPEIRNDINEMRNDITEMCNGITEIRNGINKIRGTSKTENEKVEKDISDLRISIIRTREISKNENKRTEKTISDLSTENKRIEKSISNLNDDINRIHEAFQTEKEIIIRAISDFISNLSNGINEIRKTESKHTSQGLNLFSTTNNIRTRQYPDYSNKETLRKEFQSLVDQKTKYEGYSNNSLFNEIAIASEGSICSKTVYNYYHRISQNPQNKTVNAIRKWVIKEVEKNSNLNNSLVFIVLGGF